MKTLVVSDVVSEALYGPEIRTLCEGVELILSCGDLPAPYLEYLPTMLGVPLLYVQGNHDGPIHTHDGRVVRGPEGAIDLDGRVVEIPGRRGGLQVAGFAGSMYYGGETNQYTEQQMRRKMRRLAPQLTWSQLRGKRPVDVLVTHAAPYGIHDGKDRCHVGFRAFLTFMRRYAPALHLHGHVHPSYGHDTEPRTYERTTIRSIYGYAILEITEC